MLLARWTGVLALIGTCTTGASMGFFESESELEPESDSEESDSEELDPEELDSDSSDDEREDEDEDRDGVFLVPLAFTFFV